MYKEIVDKNKWKNQNSNYLYELQKFLDLADNIENEELRKLIINQMIRCDRCLTNIAEEKMEQINKQNKMEDK